MSNIQFLTYENLTESVATAQTICLSGGQSIKTVLVSLCENKKLFASKKIILSDERESCNRDDSNYHTLKSILPNCCEIIEPKDMWRDASLFIDLDLALLGFGVDGHIASIFPGMSNADLDYRGCFFRTKTEWGDPLCRRYSISEPMICNAKNLILIVNTPEKLLCLETMLSCSRSTAPLKRLINNRDDVRIFKAL